MKRVSNIYEEILDLDNLYDVYKDIKKSYKNKFDLYKYSMNLNTNLINILNKLKENSYVFSEYKLFLIKDPKYRIIMSENLNDKIVNHLVSKFGLLKILEKSLIDTNVATRNKKGSSYAFKYFVKYFNSLKHNEEIYILKIDIQKYFYNIDHNILMKKIINKTKDKKLISVIESILNTTNYEYINNRISCLINDEVKRVQNLKISNKEKVKKIDILNSIPKYSKNKGLPIGNLSSQILAVYYLSSVDHFIKECLKLKCYIRYMDDLVIMCCDKERLISSFKLIERKISDNNLVINKKSGIFKLSNGFSFLGYTFKKNKNKLLIRNKNSTYRRIKRKLNKLKKIDLNKYFRSYFSYKGYICVRKMNGDIIMNGLYGKYLELKKESKNNLLLMKKGKFYITYDTDALILNYLFNYKIVENKVGFPLNSLFKIKTKLKLNKISVAMYEDNNYSVEELEESNYEILSSKAFKVYEENSRNDEIIEKIRSLLKNSKEFYDNLLFFINGYE